jgi:hypothetical protein
MEMTEASGMTAERRRDLLGDDGYALDDLMTRLGIQEGYIVQKDGGGFDLTEKGKTAAAKLTMPEIIKPHERFLSLNENNPDAVRVNAKAEHAGRRLAWDRAREEFVLLDDRHLDTYYSAKWSGRRNGSTTSSSGPTASTATIGFSMIEIAAIRAERDELVAKGIFHDSGRRHHDGKIVWAITEAGKAYVESHV